MATIKQLIEDGQIAQDHWLALAGVEKEDVEIEPGRVIWHDGNWHDGAWLGGNWYRGNWYRGNWHDGNWHDGTWRGGNWRGGNWRGGKSSPIRCKHHISTKENGLITIGCKTRTVKEWDEFFASDEIIETPRNTEAFWLIERAYQAARAAVLFEQQNPEP